MGNTSATKVVEDMEHEAQCLGNALPVAERAQPYSEDLFNHAMANRMCWTALYPWAHNRSATMVVDMRAAATSLRDASRAVRQTHPDWLTADPPDVPRCRERVRAVNQWLALRPAAGSVVAKHIVFSCERIAEALPYVVRRLIAEFVPYDHRTRSLFYESLCRLTSAARDNVVEWQRLALRTNDASWELLADPDALPFAPHLMLQAPSTPQPDHTQSVWNTLRSLEPVRLTSLTVVGIRSDDGVPDLWNDDDDDAVRRSGCLALCLRQTVTNPGAALGKCVDVFADVRLELHVVRNAQALVFLDGALRALAHRRHTLWIIVEDDGQDDEAWCTQLFTRLAQHTGSRMTHLYLPHNRIPDDHPVAFQLHVYRQRSPCPLADTFPQH